MKILSVTFFLLFLDPIKTLQVLKRPPHIAHCVKFFAALRMTEKKVVVGSD